MKKRILTLFALLAVAAGRAQTPTSYFMEWSLFRSDYNPAFTPRTGYLNIPALSGVQVGTTGNISVKTLLRPVDGTLYTIFANEVKADDALRNLHANNDLVADTRMNLFGIGMYRADRKTFCALDINLRAEAEMHLPYELVEFMKTAGINGNTHLLAHNLGASVQSYIETAFTWSMPLRDERFRLGLRGKILLGAASASVDVDRLEVYTMGDEWLIRMDGRFLSSGAKIKPKTRTEDGSLYYDLKKIKTDSFGAPAGVGAGIDAGVTFDVLPELQLSAAINDLGFISWMAKATNEGTQSMEASYTGTFSTGTQTDKNKLDFGDFQFDRVESDGFTKMLHTSFNIGGQYKLWDRRVSLGAWYNVRFWDDSAVHQITASAALTPIEWFTVATSYSFLHNRGHAAGLALNFAPWRGVNFFLATDMLLTRHTKQFLPLDSPNMHFTFGLGIPIGKSKAGF